MAHVREQIRKAVAAAVTGLATTGTNVSTSMIHAWQESSLPALAVKTARNTEEEVEGDIMGADGWRSLVIEIEARVKAVSGVEDALDDICVEVEAAVATDSGIDALTQEVKLASTEITLDGDGEKPVGVATMTWVLLYRTNSTDPTVTV